MMNPHTSSERQDASDFFFTVTELERHDLVSMIFRCRKFSWKKIILNSALALTQLSIPRTQLVYYEKANPSSRLNLLLNGSNLNT